MPQRGPVPRQEERFPVDVAGDVARVVIVGQADEVAVVPADGVLEPAVGEEPVGEQAGLARQAEV